MRVKVEIKAGEGSVVATALLNSGYETDEPEIHLPGSLAGMLGLRPETQEEYRAVGVSVETRVLGYVEVRVIARDRQSDWVRARAVSVEKEQEVLISDRLIDALGLEPIKPGIGLWRFSGEKRLRTSLEPELWS